MTEVKGFSVTGELGRKIGLIDNHATDIRVFVAAETDNATRIKNHCRFQAAPAKSRIKVSSTQPWVSVI